MPIRTGFISRALARRCLSFETVRSKPRLSAQRGQHGLGQLSPFRRDVTEPKGVDDEAITEDGRHIECVRGQPVEEVSEWRRVRDYLLELGGSIRFVPVKVSLVKGHALFAGREGTTFDSRWRNQGIV